MPESSHTDVDEVRLVSDDLRSICIQGDVKALERYLLSQFPPPTPPLQPRNQDVAFGSCLLAAAQFASSGLGTPRMLKRQASKMIEMLFCAGATCVSYEWTFLKALLESANLDAIRVAQKHSFPINKFSQASIDFGLISADPSVFEILHALGFDLNRKDNFFETAFLRLCANRIVLSPDEDWHASKTKELWYLGRIRKLIDAGVDINATDKLGASGLMRTIVAGNFHLARALILAGASTATRLANGVTTTHIAASSSPRDFLRFYLDQRPPSDELALLNCKRMQPDSKSLIQAYLSETKTLVSDETGL